MNKLHVQLIFALLILCCMSMHVRAVDYELPDINGQVQSLEQYKGKWLVVNYWATWCVTCMKELPDLVSLHRDNQGGDIAVVGINFESIDEDRLKSFIAEHSVPYLVLRTEPVRKTPLGPVPALPTTYIIDPNGKVVAGEVGIVSKQNLEDYIAGKRSSKDYAGDTRQAGSGTQG